MTLQISNPVIKYSLLKFSGGEIHVELNELPKVTPTSVDVRADIHSSDDFMTLLLIHNALINHYGKSLQVNLEIPYFPYARQDRVCAVGQTFSLQVVSKIISDMKLNSLTVWDAHSPVMEELLQVDVIQQSEIISSSEKLVTELSNKNMILVCPDQGAKDKCQHVKERFNIENMISSNKVREPNTGEITDTELSTETLSTDDLSGKTAIIIDDICDGGRTFIEIAKRLKEKNAERVILYVTHGIFSKGLEIFDGLIDEIFTSNSFPQKKNPKLTVINFQTVSKSKTKRN